MEPVLGDTTQLDVDAIVNAANAVLLGGGAGAIHRAVGPELVRACRSIAEFEPGVRCPPAKRASRQGSACAPAT